MTDIEQKALALVNEVLEGKALNNTPFTRLPTAVSSLVLLRAIEQHETFKQEVSDAIAFALKVYRGLSGVLDPLKRFIIPKPKPDPLVEVMKDLGWDDGIVFYVADLRTALEARGLEIREKNDD
jgi:hypothetical protein